MPRRFENLTFLQFFETLYPDLAAARRSRISTEERLFSPPAGLGTVLPEKPESFHEQIDAIRALPRVPHTHSRRRVLAVILTGGKGTRMLNGVPQKSLSMIAGKPALLRAMETCRSLGIGDFALVVGIGFPHVLECLEGFPARLSFLYQHETRGTGHAAQFASRYLHLLQWKGPILVLMGDKWITRDALQAQLVHHAQSGADLTLAAGRKADSPDSGRVVMDEEGMVQAIIEKPDIVFSQILEAFYRWPEDPVPCREYLQHLWEVWNRPGKIQHMLGQRFWNQLQTLPHLLKAKALLPKHARDFSLPFTSSLRLTGNELERRCDWVNLSVYVFQPEPFYESLESLHPNNVQRELYLTDAVAYLASSRRDRRVCAAFLDTPGGIMGFNTQEELEKIERSFMEANAV